MKPLGGLTAILLLVASLRVDAHVVFDSGVTTINAAISSNTQIQSIVADDFRLEAGSNVIADVHWSGVYQSGNTPLTDAFSLQIYDDSGGMPDGESARVVDIVGEPLRMATGETLGFEIYRYSVDIAPVMLDPNTTYWLAIFNDPAGGAYNWSWAGANENSGNAHGAGSPDATAWFARDFEADFQLTSKVPEPAGLAVLATALVALGALRRRRL